MLAPDGRVVVAKAEDEARNFIKAMDEALTRKLNMSLLHPP
jgi:hypothetical protein